MPWTRGQFQVMGKFRPFIHQITAFNPDNFSTTARHQLIHNLQLAFAMVTLFIILLYICSLDLWLCFFIEHEWNRRAYQFATAFCLIQQFIIYALMSSKSRQIVGVLDQLQMTVEKRKHFHLAFFIFQSDGGRSFQNFLNLHILLSFSILQGVKVNLITSTIKLNVVFQPQLSQSVKFSSLPSS